MIETVKNAWKIPELRKKLTFVLFAIIIYPIDKIVSMLKSKPGKQREALSFW